MGKPVDSDVMVDAFLTALRARGVEITDDIAYEAATEAFEAAEEANAYSDDDYDDYGDVNFADPGGNSALRAATPGNPRNLPCPDCGEPDRLTPADAALGYRCDECADQAERGW